MLCIKMNFVNYMIRISVISRTEIISMQSDYNKNLYNAIFKPLSIDSEFLHFAFR